MAQEADVPSGLWGRIEKLIDDKIAQFARSGFLRNASISGGAGLTIKDGGQLRAEYPDDLGAPGPMFYLGPIVAEVDGSYLGTGMLVQAPDGTDMVTFRTDAGFGTTMKNIYDDGNRIIFGNDAASGQGLARPWVPGAFYRARFGDWTVSTTSATFETLWRAEVIKQHPKLSVAIRASMDAAGTTGELRVMVDGVQLGGTEAIVFGQTTRLLGPASVAGEHMQLLTVEIQGRRTSASGALRVEPLHLLGRQS